ncbi:hypothetical protein DQK91_18975 [Oceanidesulfovibrio marinus]|uniref:Uncharacterized protein n=1 Tax=Oceanidesulfovibrio marinus TaxID=370038 RepID=A0A6P1ZBA7_9BACT|nr:hypothetical protein DQK91_18975 [Oceanidesulfovibrio marinus]
MYGAMLLIASLLYFDSFTTGSPHRAPTIHNTKVITNPSRIAEFGDMDRTVSPAVERLVILNGVDDSLNTLFFAWTDHTNNKHCHKYYRCK